MARAVAHLRYWDSRDLTDQPFGIHLRSGYPVFTSYAEFGWGGSIGTPLLYYASAVTKSHKVHYGVQSAQLTRYLHL
jgi:hypothetical protein